VSKTFVDIQTSLGDWLAKDTTQLPTTTRKDIINAGVKHICEAAGWSFCERSGGVTIVSGTKSTPLPSETMYIRRAYYTNSAGEITDLVQMFPVEMLDEYGVDPDDGEPQAFSTWGGNLNVERNATAYVGVNLDYYGRLSDLVNDADTNFLTSNHWLLVLLASLIAASAYGFEDSRVGLWQALYEQELAQVKTLDSYQRHSARYLDTNEPG
jgi:hypothetical protein